VKLLLLEQVVVEVVGKVVEVVLVDFIEMMM
jgi:hypothetical protein